MRCLGRNLAGFDYSGLELMTEAWAGSMESEFIRIWMVVKDLFSESAYEETIC